MNATGPNPLESALMVAMNLQGQRPPDDLREYAARLYQRRNEATIIPLARARIGSWTPVRNDCHANVTIACQTKPECRPVRGWLYFDFSGSLAFVRFSAHSVIQIESGELYDITPLNASQQYPFIRSELSEDDYAQIVNGRRIGNLDHFK